MDSLNNQRIPHTENITGAMIAIIAAIAKMRYTLVTVAERSSAPVTPTP